MKRKGDKNWTPAEDLELKLLCARGFTTGEIADRLGRSFEGVKRRKYLLRCHSNGSALKLTQINEIITRYYEQEQTMATISREMEISYTTVRKYVNNYWRKKS